MFGFLNPLPHSDDYRRAYARLCVHQRRRFGVRSLPFHSYDAVFLYQLALDAGAVDAGCLPDHRCCKLGFRGTIAADAEVGMFCASFAVLLASIKIDDDIRDSRSVLARFAAFALRNRIERAKRNLRKYHPDFDATVAGFVAQHHRLEQPGRTVALEEYAVPTAEAFGYLFGLFAGAIRKPERRDVFRSLGRKVGRAIIAFDCAADWHRDRRHGEFNPLPDESAVERSLEFCWNQLSDTADLARVRLGHRSRAATTAGRVADRIARFRPEMKPAFERGWLALTTGRLAFAGMRASAGGEPTFDVAPPIDLPVDEPVAGWRKKVVDGMVPPERSATKPQDDCCASGVCALEGCNCCWFLPCL